MSESSDPAANVEHQGANPHFLDSSLLQNVKKNIPESLTSALSEARAETKVRSDEIKGYAEAMKNYAFRVWKISNWWRTPPTTLRSREEEINKPKVLIVYSDTGGGHKASAASIAAAIDQIANDKVEVKIVDIMEDYTLWASNRTYNFFSSLPWLWGAIYNSTKRTHSLSGNVWILDPARVGEPSVLEGFIRCVQEERPDIIVSVHPILQSAPRATSSHMKDGKRIPFVTVVTDLGEAHPWWFNKGLDKMFVPIEEMKSQALEFGLKEEQVVVCGLPLRKGFWNIDSSKSNKEQMREKLELRQDWRVVILIGGGDGMGKLKECAMSFFARKSDERMRKLQIVVICGKNEKLQKQLIWEAEKVKEGLAECDIRILGFVSNMEEWMIAADVLVTKAGPGTIAEACCCGLPVLLFDFLPGQEEGNVTFVESSGMGEFIKDATKVGSRCLDWLEDEEGLVRMQQASFKHAERNSTAAMKIARQTLDVILDEEDRQSIDESVNEWAGKKKETLAAPAASKFVYKSSWWSWFSPANLTQAPSWWREAEVKE